MENPFAEMMRDVGPAEAPQLHQAVEALCAKAGIEKPVIRFVHNTGSLNPIQKFQMEHMAAAMHIDHPAIILGEKMRAILGHASAHDAIGEEFNAVLAHEIGHLKYGDVKLYKILPLRLSPILGMIAGAAGMHLYQHIHAKAETARKNGMPEPEIDALVQQQWNVSNQGSVALPPMKPHYEVTKTIAGALLGIGAGTAFYALAHRHTEFRADRVSMELMQDGKPLASALRKIRQGFENSVHASPEMLEAFRNQNPVARFYQKLMHPPLEQRLQRAESWVRA